LSKRIAVPHRFLRPRPAASHRMWHWRKRTVRPV